MTVIVTLEVLVSAVSLAVNRSTYVPELEKLAVVDSAFMSPNVTVPGPLNFDQVVVNTPDGKLSSLALPLMFADEGSVIV